MVYTRSEQSSGRNTVFLKIPTLNINYTGLHVFYCHEKDRWFLGQFLTLISKISSAFLYKVRSFQAIIKKSLHDREKLS